MNESNRQQQGTKTEGTQNTTPGTDYNRRQVEDIRAKVNEVDAPTAIEVTRIALQKAQTSGASFDQMKGLLQEFGDEQRWGSNR